MLSAICLEAGCKHVTGIDTNEAMCHLAQKHLRPLGRPLRGSTGPRFEILHCANRKAPEELEGRKFDMMVGGARGKEAARTPLAPSVLMWARGSAGRLNRPTHQSPIF